MENDRFKWFFAYWLDHQTESLGWHDTSYLLKQEESNKILCKTYKYPRLPELKEVKIPSDP